MSKRINVNPDHYKQAGRERQGDAIVHGEERAEWERTGRQRRRAHDKPHIPNQEHASTPRQPPQDQVENNESVHPRRTTDDEGMAD